MLTTTSYEVFIFADLSIIYRYIDLINQSDKLPQNQTRLMRLIQIFIRLQNFILIVVATFLKSSQYNKFDGILLLSEFAGTAQVVFIAEREVGEVLSFSTYMEIDRNKKFPYREYKQW